MIEEIKIICNGNSFGVKSLNLDDSLNIIREKLKNELEIPFFFLYNESKEIKVKDEKYYKIRDIIKEKTIKLKEDKRKINFDFSQYEIKEKREGLTIYKYSSLPRTQPFSLVYQYFYDQYEPEDYNNAYIVLFCGKTGDGKTTAINALFNIIKGITLEQDWFILIDEKEKKRGQAESQTDGVHIYYLRDYNNSPVIIIDSQGYGDTRGKEYDDLVDKAFQYVFSNVIDHINAVGFIVKSTTNRIDILTKYIFSSVTSLFSEDISENFIILSTFANKTTMEKGPDFVSSIKTDADFLKI